MNRSRVRGPYARFCERDEVNQLAAHLTLLDFFSFLHRTASAVIEAKRFNAPKAAMVVHSFSQSSEWFEDYAYFLKLFGVVAQVGALVGVGERDGVELCFEWAKGRGGFLGNEFDCPLLEVIT